MGRRVLPIFSFVVGAGMMLTSPVAYADLAVRVGSHDDYARLVFEWDALPGYTVKKTDDSHIRIDFKKAADVDFSVLTGDSRVVGVTRASEPGAPLSLVITTAPGLDIRHFDFNSRLVLDLLGRGEKASRSQAVPPAEPASAKTTSLPEKKPEKQQEEKPHAKASESEGPHTPTPPPEEDLHSPPSSDSSSPATAHKEAAHDKDSGPAVKAVKVPAVEESVLSQADADISPHVVTFSTTEAVGTAAFIRNGYLWLVFDRGSIRVPPELAGPQVSLFGPLERVSLSGAAAYRMKLPQDRDVKIYGEGGGLVWRVVLTSKEHDVTPVAMERRFAGSADDIRSGTLLWPVVSADNVIDFSDPDTGDVVKVVTVDGATNFTGPAREYVDFMMLAAPIGMAIVPKIDDLSIEAVTGGVEITRPGGLAISRNEDIGRRKIREKVGVGLPQTLSEDEGIVRIFDFDAWQMGGVHVLNDNQRILMGAMGLKDKTGMVEDLLTLAKMNVANDRGPEALGFLHYAEQLVPDLKGSAEFVALRGAAYALAGKYKDAMKDFSTPSLKSYTELDYWRAYTLAWLEDWQQAKENLPSSYSVLTSYPLALLEKMGAKLAEIHLRAGEVQEAEALIAVLNHDRDKLYEWTKAGLDYLKGEAHRQSGEYDLARQLWAPLVTGNDDFYRARAGLALTMLELSQKVITLDGAIDRLEGLRYAWRGDELEAQINFQLGKLYLDKEQYIKGFSILRDAAGMSPDSDIGREITSYMADRYKKTLMEDESLSPLDAVAVYEEFRELTPLGDEGNLLTQRLAERLVEADLLSRAAKILQHQIDYRLEGVEKADVAMRLSSLYLMNDEPDMAAKSLAVARDYYNKQGAGKKKTAVLRRAKMLEAKTLAEMDKPLEALELLDQFDPAPDINRLMADIAWEAGLWEDAADALQDMIIDESLDKARGLNDEQAELILNRAVALNLSGNRIALDNMRKRYLERMNETRRGKLFEVITRPRQGSFLADRDTLKAIVAEVDIFSDFLESYKENEGVE